MKKVQIYQLKNLRTGKLYIGKSSDYKKRWKRHQANANKGINRYLYDSMRYHGFDAWELSLLEEVDEVSSNERERFWISELDTLYPNGYNMTEGGDGGNTLSEWSEEERMRLWASQAEKRKGRKVSEETKKLISEKAKGRKHSEDAKKKMSKFAILSGKRPPVHHNGNGGYLHSEEDRKKMSAARLGKSYEEIFSKEKAIELKLKRSEEWKGVGNPNYVEIPSSVVNMALSILSLCKINMSQLSNRLNLSEYKVRQLIRSLGVDNYQKLCQSTTEEEWKEFWNEKRNEN